MPSKGIWASKPGDIGGAAKKSRQLQMIFAHAVLVAAWISYRLLKKPTLSVMAELQ
ncbi:MAG: hypothetical protein ACLPWG_13265 [Steroidobacteraceae bacterium]